MNKNLAQKKTHNPHPTTKVKQSLRIGELLVKEGFVAEQDVQKALAIQQEEAMLVNLPIGQILIKMGFISRSALESLLSHPHLRKGIGAMAVEKGLIKKEQLDACLKMKMENELMGEFLIKRGLLTQDEARKLFREQINSPKLGQLGVELKLINEKDLKDLIVLFREHDIGTKDKETIKTYLVINAIKAVVFSDGVKTIKMLKNEE